MRRTLALIGCSLLLVSCGGERHGDLRQELQQMTKDLRGRVDPLPTVKEYKPVDYAAEGEVDPFRPDRIIVVQSGTVAAATGKLAPDLNRPKEPLEAFALESISMVGTITRDAEIYALVHAGRSLYRVKKGNYMGQNFGVITAIDDFQIEIKELVQDGTGEWAERESALQLQEVGRR